MASRSECLLNNALNDDFQKMLWPFHIPQKLLCAAKYRIKDNFILPNSRVYCVLSILLMCSVFYFYFTTGLTTSCTFTNRCPLIIDGHYLLAYFIATACVIVQTEAAVKLLVRMQIIDRKLRSFGVSNLTYLVVKNWCSIVSLLIYHVTIIVLYVVWFMFTLPWTNCLAIFMFIVLDLDLLYATSIVEFLCSRLERTSNLFSAHKDNPLHVSVEKNLRETFKDFLLLPKEILQAFTEASRLMQYTILSYVLSMFINSLLTVQILIEWTNNVKDISVAIDTDSPITYVLLVLWHIQKLAFVIMFSVTCQRFYSLIDGTKSVCAAILELHPEQSEYHNTAKNVLRLCDIRHSKMRVCGLFVVDAALPLRLAGLVATYSIVLLQFAFL